MTLIFSVENGFNTSYIDSLLMALFYSHSHLCEILINTPDESKFIYLQDIINNNLIDQSRNNFSTDSTVINEIRNYSIICGWKNGMNILELYNVVDYLDFIMKGFSFKGIQCELININKQKETINSFNSNYIEIKVSDESTIKKLLTEWTNIHLKNISNDENILSYYHFKEIPLLIPIYLNRSDENNQTNNFKIDIMKKIKFSNNNDKLQNGSRWSVHSIICYTNSGSGQYYSIINSNNQWYLFNNEKIPSMININITNEIVSNKIKQECVLILYKLDNIIYK